MSDSFFSILNLSYFIRKEKKHMSYSNWWNIKNGIERFVFHHDHDHHPRTHALQTQRAGNGEMGLVVNFFFFLVPLERATTLNKSIEGAPCSESEPRGGRVPNSVGFVVICFTINIFNIFGCLFRCKILGQI